METRFQDFKERTSCHSASLGKPLKLESDVNDTVFSATAVDIMKRKPSQAPSAVLYYFQQSLAKAAI